MQGDLLRATSESGPIATESCYVEHSIFTSTNGELDLKNVHRFSEICLKNGGSLNATGFHGGLQVKTQGSKLNFQLTEVYGDSFIEARDPKEFIINISEFIEEHSYVSADAHEVILHSTLSHLNDKLIGNKRFEIGDPDRCHDQLKVISSGRLELGKMSWIDLMKQKFPTVN